MRFVSRVFCLVVVSAALSGCDSEGQPNSTSDVPDQNAANAALGKMPAAPGPQGKTAPKK